MSATIESPAVQIAEGQQVPQLYPLPPLRGDEPRVAATVWSRLTPEELYDRLVNDSLVNTNTKWGIFPGVTGTEGQQGTWGDAVGKTRYVTLTDGTRVTERMSELERGRIFAYHMTSFTNIFGKLSYGVYGAWVFKPADGGTQAEWSWIFPARGPVRNLILKYVVKPLRQRYTEDAAARMIKACEGR